MAARSPYGHHGSAGNGDVRTVDEASIMAGLTPVAGLHGECVLGSHRVRESS